MSATEWQAWISWRLLALFAGFVMAAAWCGCGPTCLECAQVCGESGVDKCGADPGGAGRRCECK